MIAFLLMQNTLHWYVVFDFSFRIVSLLCCIDEPRTSSHTYIGIYILVILIFKNFKSNHSYCVRINRISLWNKYIYCIYNELQFSNSPHTNIYLFISFFFFLFIEPSSSLFSFYTLPFDLFCFYFKYLIDYFTFFLFAHIIMVLVNGVRENCINWKNE